MAAEQILIPQCVEKVIETLEQSGFEAWCVGGCVRDSLLGRTPGDWDVTTSALPEEILNCCNGFRTVKTGIKHGTITVISSGQPIEVTTFRSDSDYADHRHPNKVEFSRRIEDDLSRRDFTVNAMAYHPQRGFRDEFGGRNDLKNRVLRCVGEPRLRFTEDALRILRCIRFASVLGFTIENDTEHALFECKGLLKSISNERVREELTKLICGEHAGDALRRFAEIIFTTLHELAPMKGCTQETSYHCFDVWEHTLHAVDFAPREAALRWAVLLHDCGKPSVKSFDDNGVAHFHGHDRESAEIATGIMKRLRFSNSERDEISALILHHGERPPLPEKRIKRLLGSLGEETTFKLFALMKSDLFAKAEGIFDERIAAIEDCENTARGIIAQKECVTLKDLAINGSSLLEIGFDKGPALGKALNTLLDEVLDGTLKNESDALLKRALEISEHKNA